MHNSAYNRMKWAVDHYIKDFNNPTILDFGSRVVASQKLLHKTIFENYKCTYIGTDVADGLNVDMVMPEPYTIPAKNDSFDMIITGQTIEHIPFVWASFVEMARVLKPNGILISTAPSRGHIHCPPFDCWRYFPDSMRALGTFCNLEVLHSSTHFPPFNKTTKRLDYQAMPGSEYWGDTLGIFRKGKEYDEKRIKPFRESLLAWSNANSEIYPVQGVWK